MGIHGLKCGPTTGGDRLLLKISRVQIQSENFAIMPTKTSGYSRYTSYRLCSDVFVRAIWCYSEICIFICADEIFKTSKSAYTIILDGLNRPRLPLTKALFKGIGLNPNIHTLHWPKYEKWSMSRSCSQDDFAYRWFQKIFKYVNSCKDIFKSEIAFSKFSKIFENAVLTIFTKIWVSSVILSNFEKQFLSA